MQTKTITTSSGYIATIRTNVSYGIYSQIQNVLTESMRLDLKNKETQQLNGSAIIKANQKALELLLVELKDQQGQVISNPFQAVDELPAQDGIEISEEINQVWSSVVIEKKRQI